MSTESLRGKHRGIWLTILAAVGLSLLFTALAKADGETTEVTLELSSPVLVGAYIVDVAYEGASAESCAAEGFAACNTAFAPGVVRFTGASVTGFSGPLGSIAFDGEPTSLTAIIVQAADTEGIDLPAGSVKVRTSLDAPESTRLPYRFEGAQITW